MTNRATYLSQDALLLRNNFLNLVVDGIKTQLSDQPINDHKLTKTSRTEQGHTRVPSISFHFELSTIPVKALNR